MHVPEELRNTKVADLTYTELSDLLGSTYLTAPQRVQALLAAMFAKLARSGQLIDGTTGRMNLSQNEILETSGAIESTVQLDETNTDTNLKPTDGDVWKIIAISFVANVGFAGQVNVYLYDGTSKVFLGNYNPSAVGDSKFSLDHIIYVTNDLYFRFEPSAIAAGESIDVEIAYAKVED